MVLSPFQYFRSSVTYNTVNSGPLWANYHIKTNDHTIGFFFTRDRFSGVHFIQNNRHLITYIIEPNFSLYSTDFNRAINLLTHKKMAYSDYENL